MNKAYVLNYDWLTAIYTSEKYLISVSEIGRSFGLRNCTISQVLNRKKNLERNDTDEGRVDWRKGGREKHKNTTKPRTLTYLYLFPQYVADLKEISKYKKVILIQIEQNYISLPVLWPTIWHCGHKEVIASLSLITVKFTDTCSLTRTLAILSISS